MPLHALTTTNVWSITVVVAIHAPILMGHSFVLVQLVESQPETAALVLTIAVTRTPNATTIATTSSKELSSVVAMLVTNLTKMETLAQTSMNA